MEMEKIWNYKCVFMVIAIFYFLFSPAHCLIVYPIDAGELELMQTYHYTTWIENTENRTYEIVLSITPRSEYLDPYVTMSPNHLVIGPYEKNGIDLTLSLPDDMAPGEHMLTILPEIIETGLSGTLTLGMSVIEMKFSIPGAVRKELGLSDFNITVNSSDVEFMLLAENTGNVRLGAFAYVEIRRYYGSPATMVNGKTQYLIEPDSSVEMQLGYSLQPGTYYATAYLDYIAGISNKITRTFTISTTDEEVNETTEETEDQEESLPETEIIINETIDITDEEEPEKISEIRVRKLEAEPVYIGQALSIILEIENIGPDDLIYQFNINIFDINGERLETISDSGTLNGYEIKRIEREWSTSKPGDYNVKAEILYGNNLADKQEKGVWTRVLEKTPTGLVIADPSNLLAGILFALIVLAIVWYRRVRK